MLIPVDQVGWGSLCWELRWSPMAAKRVEPSDWHTDQPLEVQLPTRWFVRETLSALDSLLPRSQAQQWGKHQWVMWQWVMWQWVMWQWVMWQWVVLRRSLAGLGRSSAANLEQRRWPGQSVRERSFAVAGVPRQRDQALAHSLWNEPTQAVD